jgi:hypothetical protein
MIFIERCLSARGSRERDQPVPPLAEPRNPIEARRTYVTTNCPLRSVGIPREKIGSNIVVFCHCRFCPIEVDSGPGSINAQSIVDCLQQQLLELLAARRLDEPEVEIFAVGRKVLGCIRATARLFERQGIGERRDFACGCVLGRQTGCHPFESFPNVKKLLECRTAQFDHARAQSRGPCHEFAFETAQSISQGDPADTKLRGQVRLR